MPAYDASDEDENFPEGFGDNPNDNPADGERIAKALARAGVASRREVERYIEDRRVALNGQVLTTPAVKVKPGDILTVDGMVVGDAEPTRLFRYHKPTGLMTSHNDPQGRPTVFAALPPGLPRLISVGRLDLNSEGLLLLTNDGALSRALELPSSNWPRQYRARAFGDTTQEKLDRLKAGTTIEGVHYGPIEARLDKAKDSEGRAGKNLWITVTLTEGKNREVRRVLESLGLKVNRLIRLAYGPFVLGTLGQGEVEEVGPRVIREQLVGLVEEHNMPKGDRPQFTGGVSKAMRRGPGGEGGGMTAGRRAPTPKAPVEAKPKPEYKAGWAKPKSKPSPHAPTKAGSKSARSPRRDVPEAPKPEWAAQSRSPAAKPFARSAEAPAKHWRDAKPPRGGDVRKGPAPEGAERRMASKPFIKKPGQKSDRPFTRDAEAPRSGGGKPQARTDRPRRDDATPAREAPRTTGGQPFVKSYARPAEPTRGASDRPPSRSDRPPSGSGRFESRSDRPEPRGDRPPSRSDRPEPRADRPQPRTDRPSPRQEAAAAREAPSRSGSGKPFVKSFGKPTGQSRGQARAPIQGDPPRPERSAPKSSGKGAFAKGGAHRSGPPKDGPHGARPGRKGPPRPPKR